MRPAIALQAILNQTAILLMHLTPNPDPTMATLITIPDPATAMISLTTSSLSMDLIYQEIPIHHHPNGRLTDLLNPTPSPIHTCPQPLLPQIPTPSHSINHQVQVIHTHHIQRPV